MNVAELRQPSASSHTYLLVPILLLFVLLAIAVLRAPNLISNVGIGSAIIVAAPLILATYALTIIAMAGRAGVDLSIGPLIGFVNVSTIQLFDSGVLTTPVEFFAYAIAVAMLYQLLMGLIIVYVRVQPIIVALSGFLALVGLNLVILPRPGGIAPDWMMPWGLGDSIWSPVLAIVVLATFAWFVLTRTAFFGHLRLMGADERTAFTGGVRINIVRLGAHLIAGVFSALAAITFTSLISSGDPTQGTTYTLMAVTALVLGGTSLAGGRGSIIGSLLGALNIYLITYVLSTFSFGMVQSFVTDAAYGVVLVVSLLLTLTLPRLPNAVLRISPLAFFVVLGIIAFGVILYSKDALITQRPVTYSSDQTVLGAESGSAEGSGLTVLGAEPETAGESGLTVLGVEPETSSESGLTVLGAEPESPGDSGPIVLGAEPDDSGLTVLGADTGEPAAEAPKGTPLVYAAIVIAAVIYLVYLLYRHPSVSLVALIGVLILLVLGLSLYDGLGSATGITGSHPPRLFLYEVIAPGVWAPGGSFGGATFARPMIAWLLIVVATVLFSSLLIVLTLPKVRSQIGNVPLLFLLALGAVAIVVIVNADRGANILPDGYSGAIGMVLLGAVLFIVSLPRVQGRVKDLTIVLLAILSAAGLAAMYFANSPGSGAAMSPAPTQEPTAAVLATELPSVSQVVPSDAFYAGVFWVLLAAVALFIFTLPLVRTKILTYASLQRGVKVFSYTGGFIVISSVIAMGALFHAAGVPLWKLGVAIVSAVIAARYGWHFLHRYRGGSILAGHPHDSRGRAGAPQMFGTNR